MTHTVRFNVDGAIAEVVIDNPPVNAASASVRQGLADAFRRFAGDPALRALIVRCAGRTFCAGADINEFGKPMADPVFPEVLELLDALDKPVIAAVHGSVLGGGFELALACHYRIADPAARFGFPEVKLGLFPGAGGTQRAPRLAGLALTIELVTGGNPIGAAKAHAAGLIDRIAEGDLAAAAQAYATELIAQGAPARSAGTLPLPADDPALFAEARQTIARKQRGQTAPLLALDAIRLGYEMPFAEALQREYALCLEAVASPQSAALRHVFGAERMVARVPDDARPRAMACAGVIGLGTMGRGIIMAIAAAGVPVIAIGRDLAQSETARTAITKMLAASVTKGSLTQAAADAQLARITWSADPADLSGADLVIESVAEDMATKRAIFAQLGVHTRPGTILASNTSYLDIDDLAQASGRPADVCGMHFFNPANVMRLLENVRGAQTDPAVVATIMAFGQTIGKLPIVSGVCEGFIVNRMLAKRSREAYFLVEEGAKPAAIDKVVRDFGFPMGPFALGDLAGLDVQAAARKARSATATARELRADFVEQMVASGRFGQKTRGGWYLYDENRKPSPNPETDRMIAAHALAHNLDLRAIGDDEIRERLLFAMVNEGAKILDEGIAAHARDIDVAMINGVGWPAYTGGPMFWADQIGLGTVLAAIERFGTGPDGVAWRPAPLLVRLAGENRGFYD